MSDNLHAHIRHCLMEEVEHQARTLDEITAALDGIATRQQIKLQLQTLVSRDLINVRDQKGVSLWESWPLALQRVRVIQRATRTNAHHKRQPRIIA